MIFAFVFTHEIKCSISLHSDVKHDHIAVTYIGFKEHVLN
jgi:hypothetical protein